MTTSSASMILKTYQGLSPAGFHELSYTQWGGTSSKKPVVICVHGLTRSGRDFDFLAKVLAKEYRVICPDVVGRGKSDWLPDGKLYTFAQYLSDMNALIARLDVDQVDWVGTSMGGLMGMILASLHATPIRKLIMNDVGPTIPKNAARRIKNYAKKTPIFQSVEEVKACLKQRFAPFGTLTEPQWRHIALHSSVKRPDGTYVLSYDPRLLHGLRKGVKQRDLWRAWSQIQCPVLVLRGEKSEILTQEILDQMKGALPHMETCEIKGCGHAPALMAKSQMRVVEKWLRAGE